MGNGLVEHHIIPDICVIHRRMIDIFGNGTHLRYPSEGLKI